MSGDESEKLQALSEISEEVAIQNDKLEAQHEQSQIEQRLRATERAHFLVSLGVLSGLITYYFKNDGFGISQCLTGQSGALCALLTVSIVSISIFIPGKLLASTFLPVVDFDWLKQINDVFLPAIHVFMIISVAFALIIYAFVPGFEHLYFTASYMFIAILISLYPAYRYAGKYQEIMQKVRVTSTQRNIITTSSIGSRDGTIRLTNPNSRPIPGDEVEFSVDVPEEVRVEIGQTSGDPNEDDIVTLSKKLEGNSVMDLPVTVEPLVGNPQGEIEVKIDIPGQPELVEKLSYGVDEDHSGTTNIG